MESDEQQAVAQLSFAMGFVGNFATISWMSSLCVLKDTRFLHIRPVIWGQVRTANVPSLSLTIWLDSTALLLIAWNHVHTGFTPSGAVLMPFGGGRASEFDCCAHGTRCRLSLLRWLCCSPLVSLIISSPRSMVDPAQAFNSNTARSTNTKMTAKDQDTDVRHSCCLPLGGGRFIGLSFVPFRCRLASRVLASEAFVPEPCTNWAFLSPCDFFFCLRASHNGR
eukprot:1480361-Amphidinium_carterae.1